MKVEIAKPLLSAGLSTIDRLIGPRKLTDGHSGVVLEADDRLSLAAASRVCQVQMTLDANVSEAGSAIAPIAMLSAIASKATGPIVVTTTDDTAHIRVKAGRSRYTFNRYPRLPPLITTNEHSYHPFGTWPLSHFARLVKQVAGYADPSLGPIIGAVHFDGTEDGTMYLIASDAYRMAVAKVASPPPAKPPFKTSALLPATMLSEIVRLAETPLVCDNDSLAMSVSKYALCFKTPTTTITVPLTAGSYYSWRKFTNHNFTSHVALDKSVLLTAINAATIITNPNDPLSHQFNLVVTNNVLTISGTSPDSGGVIAEVDCQGDDMMFRIMLDRLKLSAKSHINGILAIALADSGKIVRLRSPDDPTFTSYLMTLQPPVK